MLYLVLEFLLKPFQDTQQKIVEVADDRCDDEDDDDTASVCSDATEDENKVECHSCSLIQQVVSRASFRNGRLVLTNFIARSSPRDTMDLCRLLERHAQNNSGLRTIVFRDTVDGAGYRRWLFKKTGVYRHVLNVADELGLTVQFDATVEVCTQCLSTKAIAALLGALKVDADVKSVTIVGTLCYRDALDLVHHNLCDLLQADQRHWQTICLQGLQLTGTSSSRETALARKSCYRSLHRVATQRYIHVQM